MSKVKVLIKQYSGPCHISVYYIIDISCILMSSLVYNNIVHQKYATSKYSCEI